ncbi:MAG: NAD(P)(+) transhydrogenase (Re/Si-specific) subunit beta [Planctomycetales bacterium]|nr:NAD(P)(+) transhydrogenase (Re/Si-specific) subunit beta [Planctomycetales bacterium]
MPNEAVEAIEAAAETVSTSAAISWSNLGYLLAAALFIFGIKGMTHPRTAVRGNQLGALGMLVAVLVVMLGGGVVSWPVALIAMLAGSAGGVWLANTVQMTQMPQLVALFNGFGGIASVLVAGAELTKASNPGIAGLAAGLTGLIGSVTFTGSLIAAGKLQELPQFKKPWSFGGQQIANAALLALCLLLSWMMVDGSGGEYILLVLVALVLGTLLVLPIGGADMPVVIALLNSYSGLAAAAAGFVINNNVLIIAGSLVGASGLILTNIMCKAMNRSFSNVLFGGFGQVAAAASGGADDRPVRSMSAEEAAPVLELASSVVIIPGYGMAVAQAQHRVAELYEHLEESGVEVKFAIHPVAGRMPGHMNVLLAEADVPYDQLKEMDEINPTFSQCDVAIVIGANDVVNPVANTDPHSPIAGMPILNVSDARTVVVVKRSLSPGFAGIPNPLFAADNCLMMFGDGKKAIVELVAALKEA